MKKTTITSLLALTLTAALMTGCTAAALNAEAANASGVAPAGSPSSSVSAGIAGSAGSTQYIQQTDAENIALTDAGLTSDTVKSLRSRLEYDDGIAIYDVEFWTDTDEYDYEIDAVSGEILAVDRDVESYTPSTTTTTTSGVAPQGDPITQDAARQAALSHAGVTDDGTVQFFRCDLDEEDNHHVYDVEFCANNVEYDYEIDAYTGEVLSYDHDAEYCHHENHHYGYGNGSNTTGNGLANADPAISADDAKRIALEHAGVAEADAVRLEVNLDRDDGRLEYDVEWEIGTVDYEYTVDANTGDILSFEVDD